MDIKLNDEQFAQVIGEQILSQIGPEARDKLVTDAIVALNKPEGSHWQQDKKSPLQRAFETAVDAAVRRLAAELVEQSPLRDRIVEAANAFIEVFPEEYEDEALQREVMATIVRHAREVSRRG